jgi:exodeoxyribonuclease VII small subunit
MEKMTIQLPSDIAEMDYEKAYAELESIVQTLESEPPSLEESIRLFERGQMLSQRCSQLLDGAEVKLRSLSGQELDALTEEENAL